MRNFTTWLENKTDIFGFEKDLQKKRTTEKKR